MNHVAATCSSFCGRMAVLLLFPMIATRNARAEPNRSFQVKASEVTPSGMPKAPPTEASPSTMAAKPIMRAQTHDASLPRLVKTAAAKTPRKHARSADRRVGKEGGRTGKLQGLPA